MNTREPHVYTETTRAHIYTIDTRETVVKHSSDIMMMKKKRNPCATDTNITLTACPQIDEHTFFKDEE